MRVAPILVLPLALVLALPASGRGGHGGYQYTSNSSNYVCTQWTLETPSGTIDMTKVNLTPEGQRAFLDAFNAYQYTQGVTVCEQITVENQTTVRMDVQTSSTLTGDQAQHLSAIVRDNSLPTEPEANGPPTMVTEMVNRQVTTWVVDLGDGRVLDLLAAGFDPATMTNVQDYLENVEHQNGVYLSSETTVNGHVATDDRVGSVTNLTPADLEGLWGVMRSNGYYPQTETWTYDVEADVQFGDETGTTTSEMEGSLYFDAEVPPDGEDPDRILN